MGNTWPGGRRRALSQGEHARWNATAYPGTRQCCCECGNATDRCEDDSLFVGDTGPLCEDCYRENATKGSPNPEGLSNG